jgi:hypothetical protein
LHQTLWCSAARTNGATLAPNAKIAVPPNAKLIGARFMRVRVERKVIIRLIDKWTYISL